MKGLWYQDFKIKELHQNIPIYFNLSLAKLS